jgi:hypothetical protein
VKLDASGLKCALHGVDAGGPGCRYAVDGRHALNRLHAHVGALSDLLDRKMERTLAMLIRLQDLRRGSADDD